MQCGRLMKKIERLFGLHTWQNIQMHSGYFVSHTFVPALCYFLSSIFPCSLIIGNGNLLKVDFGDFKFLRIEPKIVRYVSGVATAILGSGGLSINICVCCSFLVFFISLADIITVIFSPLILLLFL